MKIRHKNTNLIKYIFVILLVGIALFPFYLFNKYPQYFFKPKIGISNNEYRPEKNVSENDNSVYEISPTPKPSLMPTSFEALQRIRINKARLNEALLLDLINQERVKNGVNPFNTDDKEVCVVAQGALDLLVKLNRIPTEEEALKEDLGAKSDRKFYVGQGLGFESEAQAVEYFYKSDYVKQILTGGEYVWGCVKAKDNYAVLVATY